MLRSRIFIIFYPHQKKIDYQVNLQIFDNDPKTFLPLEQKSYLKYLGVLHCNNDSSLSWKYHIGHITSKIRKTIGIIARLRYYVPIQLTANNLLIFDIPLSILRHSGVGPSCTNLIHVY